jgi:hypothetical protein
MAPAGPDGNGRRRAGRLRRRQPTPHRLLFEGLDGAAVAAPKVHVATERDFGTLVAALHGYRALFERLARHLDNAEATLGALELTEQFELDLVAKDLFDTTEEGATPLLERVQVAAARSETGGRIDDLLADGCALVTLERFFDRPLPTSSTMKAGSSEPAPRSPYGSTQALFSTRGPTP